MYFLLSGCESPDILRIIYFVKLLLNIVFTVIPIILIALLIFDFSKAVVAQDDGEQKKAVKLSVKRLASAVALFFVPLIVKLVMGLVSSFGGEEFVTCYYTNATRENIANFQTIQDLEDMEEEALRLEELKNKLDNDSTIVINNNSKTAYYRSKKNKCAKYFTFSDNVIDNKSGCSTPIFDNSRAMYYEAESQTVCASGWLYTKDPYAAGLTEESGALGEACYYKYKNGIDKEQGSDGPNNGTTAQTKGTIFVGDSRTVGMCNSVTLAAGEECIAEISKGYDWFKTSAITNINNILNKDSSKQYRIIINLGINDIYNVNKYIEEFNKLKKGDWMEHKVIFVSVNPVDENLYTTIPNSKIDDFNNAIKKELNNISYCDVNSMIKDNIKTTDGLHYTAGTYKLIYTKIKTCL